PGPCNLFFLNIMTVLYKIFMSPEGPNCYKFKDYPNPDCDKVFCQKSSQDIVERQNVSVGSFEMITKEAFGVEKTGRY
ncbi:MAG: hypothetical protein WC517_03885, partial [Patescibacteria group bacterium]